MVKYILSAVILISLVGYISAGPIPKEFQEVAGDIRKVCIAETGTTVDLIERAGKGDFAEDENLKCYLKCLLAQFGLISKKGLNFEQLVKVAPPDMKDMAKQLGVTCKDIKINEAGDQCDLAYHMSKCFFNTFPEQYFIM
nr:odorant-binding protein 5 [Psyttalia incisi]